MCIRDSLKNERNAAAGALRNLDVAEVRWGSNGGIGNAVDLQGFRSFLRQLDPVDADAIPGILAGLRLHKRPERFEGGEGPAPGAGRELRQYLIL